MEQLSYDITTEVGKLTRTHVIANRYGKKYLPVFFVTATIKGLLEARNYDVVHIGDPVLSAIGWLLLKIYKKPVFVEVHGLDITFKSKIYQKYLDIFFPITTKAICISSYVKELLEKRFPAVSSIVITPGFQDVFFQPNADRTLISKLINKDLSDKKIILTVGRLVKRKGVMWFIENVFPNLGTNTIYIVAGNGPEKENIEPLVANSSAKDRIFVVHDLSREQIKLLYNTADIFVMPNILVEGDTEGFGLVAIEAASCELPVIASDLEGIKDAIVHNENGIRCSSKSEFVEKITNLLGNDSLRKEFGIKARKFTLEKYLWPNIAEKYIALFSPKKI